MPELPEVETIRRGLEAQLVGRRIVAVDVPAPKTLRPPFDSPDEFSAKLTGRTVKSVGRRGKYLILSLDNGYSLTAHLKMRGQMRVVAETAELNERTLCARMRLDDGREWRFYDIWQWGELRLLPCAADCIAQYIPALAAIGPEPLGDEFSPETIRRAAQRGPRRTVKALLLDQGVVAGVGNIYADEALHRAGIHPATKTGDLTSDCAEALYRSVRAVLEEAISLGGTQSDNFFDIGGSAGGYVPQAYGRHGKPCLRCGTLLQRTTITGRGTAYCSKCQPLGNERSEPREQRPRR